MLGSTSKRSWNLAPLQYSPCFVLAWTSPPLSSVAQLYPNLCNPWTAAASEISLSITNSHSLLKLMSIELVMSSNHPILCHPLLLLLSIFPSIRVFSNESILHIRWPNYWSFSFISPSNEHSGLISFRIDHLRKVLWFSVKPTVGLMYHHYSVHTYMFIYI